MVNLPENPMVYVMMLILVVVFGYIASVILMDVLPIIMLVAFIGLLIGVQANSEEIFRLCLIVLVVSLVLFFVSGSYVSFCESHPLGQTIIDSGEKVIVAAGDVSQP